MRRIAFVALAALAGCATVREPAYDTLIAHRGESYDTPENTLPAYRCAVDRGFGFEIDIYRSTDGRLFTFHDRDLRRTTSGVCTQMCTAVSWQDTASKVNVGGWGRWKGSKFDPTRPALLEEVLALARPGRRIYVEVKGGDAAVGWMEDIRAAFAKEPKATPGTVLFICFSAPVCKALKAAMPGYKVYWLTSAKSVEAVLERLGECGADGVDILYRGDVITADFVSRVKAAGYEFHVWTLDDPAVAAEAFARGVDTVTTNRAKYILEAYENSKKGK